MQTIRLFAAALALGVQFNPAGAEDCAQEKNQTHRLYVLSLALMASSARSNSCR